MTELKLCPFCGGWAYVHEHYLEPFGFSVGCRTDDCRGKRENTGFTYKTEAEAIAAWNTRADYHGYEQAAIEAWKSIKTWNTRAEHHVYEQRITGSGSDWGEIMCDAFDSLLASACEACTFDELERFRAYIIKEVGE